MPYCCPHEVKLYYGIVVATSTAIIEQTQTYLYVWNVSVVCSVVVTKQYIILHRSCRKIWSYAYNYGFRLLVWKEQLWNKYKRKQQMLSSLVYFLFVKTMIFIHPFSFCLFWKNNNNTFHIKIVTYYYGNLIFSSLP